MISSPCRAADSKPKYCQKCLQEGHWTYECRGKRKYLERETRTTRLNRKMEKMDNSRSSSGASSSSSSSSESGGSSSESGSEGDAETGTSHKHSGD
ncbi:unnamed protein product [Dibothriocephalus latus]|uniref:CCHC-type domain-containing protein n=1 Tax=Dibothriocephalus latus TaxID=60516 RepID=A0A3P7LWH1_DIBLA|nr:unnamed protein product [Dibothriocephalus latus]